MALNLKEDAVAGCLASKYSVRIELQMIEFAIINKMIDFLKHVFLNGKQPDLQLPTKKPDEVCQSMMKADAVS